MPTAVKMDLEAVMPFAHRCGVVLQEASPQAVCGELAWSQDLCTANGVMHGGALMTLADTLGAACAFLNLPSGATTSTIESKTNFFHALRHGRARGVAVPLHLGGTVIVVQTDIRDGEGRRIALVTQTQVVRAP